MRGRHFRSGDYVDYLRAENVLARGLRETEYVLYMRGLDIGANDDTEILARLVPSYFDRTWRHFCSHRQTPSSGRSAGPAATRADNVVYFAHPLFSQYHRNAPRWCKQLFLNALDLLLPDPLIRHSGPSSLVTAINRQAAENRWVLHLLHYIPERRGQDFDVIEDVIPLYNVEVSLRLPGPVSTVRCVPDGATLDFAAEVGRVNFSVPAVVGHQMVEITAE